MTIGELELHSRVVIELLFLSTFEGIYPKSSLIMKFWDFTKFKGDLHFKNLHKPKSILLLFSLCSSFIPT